MYMPGRLRTASRPSRTVMSRASYDVFPIALKVSSTEKSGEEFWDPSHGIGASVCDLPGHRFHMCNYSRTGDRFGHPGRPGWAKRPIVMGFFAVVSKASTLIWANDPDGLDNPLAKLVIEAPHQVADGIPKHPHESG